MSLPYRDNVAAILFRDERILLGERIHHPGSWQLPQGGLESGEDRETALLREIREELGIVDPCSVCEVMAEGPTLRYDWPPESWGEFRGQRQTLFLVRFEGTDSDLDPMRGPDPEFRKIRWFEPPRAVETCWSLKRPNLVAALEFFELL